MCVYDVRYLDAYKLRDKPDNTQRLANPLNRLLIVFVCVLDVSVCVCVCVCMCVCVTECAIFFFKVHSTGIRDIYSTTKSKYYY